MDDLNQTNQATQGQNPAVPPSPVSDQGTTPPTAGVADPMGEAAAKGESVDDPMAKAAQNQGEPSGEGLGDGQATGEKKTEGEGAETAPEKYEAFRVGDQTLPENETAAFAEAAKELGLSQEKAQKIVDSFMPTVLSRVENYKKDWLEACRADKELGGQHFNENMAIAGAGYRTYADKDLQAIFAASGLSRHPAVIRHFYRLGKSLQQDNGVAGGASASAPTRRLYQNSGMVPDVK